MEQGGEEGEDDEGVGEMNEEREKGWYAYNWEVRSWCKRGGVD